MPLMERRRDTGDVVKAGPHARTQSKFSLAGIANQQL